MVIVTARKRDRKAFVTAVEVNGGQYDSHLSRTTVSLGCKIRAAGFFDALGKVRGVVELVVTFDWEGTTSDLEVLGDTLKSAAASILRLDLGRIRTSFQKGAEELGEKRLKRPVETLKANSTVTTLNLFSNTTGDDGAVALSEALKTNSTLTTLGLWSNSIG
ncbi:MAG: hypothetical protein J3R72DRAFT_499012 [Linnemannia gamsii]|nr:MAG: hypothetical protein J3R72DRAFT_499012 [Linnemannia gamsii]